MKHTTALAKLPLPTGNPWLASPEDPATIPVPLPVIIVSVEGPYTEQDRKLWTFLLHAVWDELGEKVIHEIPIREITRLFRDLRGRHHTDWIWESAERLADTKVRWIRTEGDKRYKGVGHLFGAETEDEVREQGTLRFHFPPLLVPILKDPRRFARLRTHFLIELSGKYSVTLYELLESVANKEVPELRARVDELRQWLKVPEGKLLRWQDLRRYVLEPAVRQINDNPTGAGFRVRMKVVKESRAITGVVFEVLKTKERQAFDARLKDQEKQLNLFEVRLKTDTYEKAKAAAPGWDIYVLEAEWKEWGSQQPDWPPKNPDGAFIGFCRKRGGYLGTRSRSGTRMQGTA
jgi:replication initiator protein